MRSLVYLAAIACPLMACGGREASHAASDAGVNDDALDFDSAIDDSGVDPDASTDDANEASAPPTYPEGPYGFAKGDVFPPLNLKGRHGSDPTDVRISLLDDYDPDGSRGITGIVVGVEAQWCGPCNIWVEDLVRWWPAYRSHGARFLDLVWQQENGTLGTAMTADQWIAKHHIPFDVAFFPSASDVTAAFGMASGSIPTTYVIDPRTMRIFAIIVGVIDRGAIACTTDAECCTGDACPAGMGDHFCSAVYASCLPHTPNQPIAYLGVLMSANGDPPPQPFP